MPHLSSSHRNKQTAQQGFAIVISLTLMAFVLLLLLTITTLVKTEATSAKISKDQLTARQNALLGLQMAIGQLQKEAGPDQRITARADISNTSLPQAALWTGVWGSYDPSDPDAHLGTIRSRYEEDPVTSSSNASPAWLVSGDTVSPDVAPTDAVTLLNYIDRDNIEQTIQVERVPTDALEDDGGFAWWTSDESVKAKVNPESVDQSGFGNTINESQRQFMVPQKASLQLVSSDDWEKLLEDPTSLEKVTNLETLPLLSGDVVRTDFSKRYIADVTTNSLGVIANNRKGGLRKDLTRGLDDQYEQHLSLLPQLKSGTNDSSRLLYSDTSRSIASEAIYGDSWDVFYNYYNLYKFERPTPSEAFTWGADDSFNFGNRVKNLDDNTIADPSLYPRASRFIHGAEGQVVNFPILPPSGNAFKGIGFNPIRPLLAQMNLSYAIESILIPGDPNDPNASNKYQFRLHIYPTFIICNPYNVRLETGDAGNAPDSGAYIFSIKDQNTYKINLDGSDQNIFGLFKGEGFQRDPVTGQYLLDANGNKIPTNGGTIFGQILMKARDIVLEPGQVMILGIQNSIEVSPLDSAGKPTRGEFVLNLEGVTGKDLNEDASIICDLFTGDPNGPISTAPDPPRLESINPGAELTFIPTESRLGIQVSPSLPASAHTSGRTTHNNQYRPEVAKEFKMGTVDAVNKSKPVPFVGYNVQTMGANDTFPAFAHTNPLSFTSNTYLNWTTDDNVISSFGDAIPEHDDDNAYWGAGGSIEDGGTSRVILYDVPRQPMQNLGDFMHASFGFTAEDPLYVVGSSYPSPFIESNRTYALENGKHFIDRSYYINDRLFDEYFLSTVPTSIANGRDVSKTFPYSSNFNQSYIDNNNPLPNSRLIYNNLFGRKPTITDLQGSTAFNTAAANLLIDGPFNINSTSIDAWISLLSAFRNEKIVYSQISTLNTTETKTLQANTLENPFTRVTAPRGGSITPITVREGGPDDDSWTGFRVLSDSEIEDLAIQIVNQIKTRGPFFSLGDFINRDPYRKTNGFSTRGALQAAIDDSEINADIEIGDAPSIGDQTPNRGPGVFPIYTENLATSTAANIPGWLSQNDIVRVIAPTMTARGDTFKIRVYGDAKDKATGRVTTRAYGEAILQRTPDFFDPTDLPETEMNSLTVLQNQLFGRRFRIVSFDWIDGV